MQLLPLSKRAIHVDAAGRVESAQTMFFCWTAASEPKSVEGLNVLLERSPRSFPLRNAAASWLVARFEPIFSRFLRIFRGSAKNSTAADADYRDWQVADTGNTAAVNGHASEWLPDAAAQQDLAAPHVLHDGAFEAREDDYAAEGEGHLSVRHLRKIYKGRRVVEDVSLDVRRGEAIALLGPNGAGKTTVFYMISGLVRPDVGTIEIDGQDVTLLPMYRRARLGIGYLPQEASVFRGLSVEQNILAVLEITQPDRAARAAELEGLLEEFDLARLRKSPAIALSGGERRRCEIARSLAGHPSFILLDEPFAGVDPIAVGDIQNLVKHLKQRGIGVLITDHNVRETLGLIDRAYIIHSGRVLTEGTPDRIVVDPEVRRLYLGEDFRM
jgi:lipopolysaccharide export system ATP-binding protein